MGFFSKDEKVPPPLKEKGRWGQILEEFTEDQRSDRPWIQRAGIYLVWAIGFALAAGVVVTLLLLIIDLFAKGRLFTARNLSDWTFWAAALLMVVGLVAPSAGDVDQLTSRQKRESARAEDRQSRAIRRRIRSVYDPWRWRFWGSALFTFGLSVLIGLFS
jgi:hypothetical protein